MTIEMLEQYIVNKEMGLNVEPLTIEDLQALVKNHYEMVERCETEEFERGQAAANSELEQEIKELKEKLSKMVERAS